MAPPPWSGLGVAPRSGELGARTPITGGSLGAAGTAADVDKAVAIAHEAFITWRTTPAPVRGALVRRLGELLREHKDELGALVSIEAGKIRSEGLGEVQEMIDICDFAVGLSRQLYGLTIATERPNHRMMETWHPLGVCGVISAFNFPVAVWSWNAALAFVCGDSVVWKPSEKTPLTALADRMVREVVAKGGCELISEIASPFVTFVVSDILGVPEADRDDFRRNALFLESDRFFDRDLIERVHRHFDVGEINAGAVHLDARLDVVIDHSLDGDQEFHRFTLHGTVRRQPPR